MTSVIDSIGLGFAFVSFAAIGSFWTRLSQFFRTRPESELSEYESPLQKSQNMGSIDPHLLVILSTAATVVLGRRVVLRRVTFINQDTVSGWAEAGRNSIHLSHNLRRDTH